MQAPLPSRIDLLVEEFKQAVTSNNSLTAPGPTWQRFITNFLKRLIYESTGADRPFDAANPETPHPFVYCLSGPAVKEIGSPQSTIDSFLILDDKINQDLVNTINVAITRLNAELQEISQKTNGNYLLPSVVINPRKLFGTQEQLIKKMRDMPAESCINAIFTAIPLVGNHQLLNNLQAKLKLQPIHSEKIYANTTSMFYGMSVVGFSGAVSGDKINLKNDIMRPVLAILDGLRLEFNLDDYLSPKNLIENLLSHQYISEDAARLFTFALNRIGQLRWHLDMQNLQTQELIPINQQNIRELVDVVALLRAEANKRVKIEGNKIILNEKRPSTFAIDRANAPYLDKMFKKDNQEFNLYVGTDIIPEYIKGQTSHIAKNAARADPAENAAGIASRIFNEADHPKHLATYAESFFRCVDDGILNKDKFNQWLNIVLCRCIVDLFDVEGNLKKSIIEIINKDNAYDKMIQKDGQEMVNKNILFSYFMNPLFFNTVIPDRRFAELSGGMDSEKPSITRATQQYINEYFNQKIKVPGVLLKDIRNTNYYVRLTTVLAVFDNIIVQIKNVLSERLDEREADLYKKYLGKDTDHDSLLGIIKSLREYLQQHRGKIVSTEVFHDYRDRIYVCLNKFIIEAVPLKVELDKPKSFPVSLFSPNSVLGQILSGVNQAQRDFDAIAAETMTLQSNRDNVVRRELR